VGRHAWAALRPAAPQSRGTHRPDGERLMARPTHDQIIRELSTEGALLKSRMEELRTAVDRLPDLNTRTTLQVSSRRAAPGPRAVGPTAVDGPHSPHRRSGQGPVGALSQCPDMKPLPRRGGLVQGSPREPACPASRPPGKRRTPQPGGGRRRMARRDDWRASATGKNPLEGCGGRDAGPNRRPPRSLPSCPRWARIGWSP
jgi:hypothetical protein